MYLYVSDTSSVSIHQNNLPHDFIYELPRSLDLSGQWELSLRQVFLKTINTVFKQNLYVYCDIIEDSIVHGEWKPLLKVIRRTVPNESKDNIFVRVTVQNLSRFRITLKTVEGGIPVIQKGGILFLFELRQKT